MHVSKKITYSAAIFSILTGMSAISYAGTQPIHITTNLTKPIDKVHISDPIRFGISTMPKSQRIGNGSSTATKYYKFGVKYYERNDLDKAEYAFKAVLRADGLDKQALYYLAKIAEKQGNIEAANNYAKDFYEIDSK